MVNWETWELCLKLYFFIIIIKLVTEQMMKNQSLPMLSVQTKICSENSHKQTPLKSWQQRWILCFPKNET